MGRGFWTTKAEGFVRRYLRNSGIQGINSPIIAKTLRQVATQPHGYTLEKESDVFELCHGMGYLHTERPWPGSEKVTYIFASPIHRRYVQGSYAR